MILPDLNLLIYAYNDDAFEHSRAKAWWETCLSDTRPVGLPWAVIVGFLRLITNRRLQREPASMPEAMHYIRAWLERPHVEILTPGPRHLDLHLLGCGPAEEFARNRKGVAERQVVQVDRRSI